VSVPVGAVVSKAKGSDDNPDEKKANAKEDDASTEDTVNAGELEEVVYVVKNDGTVEKRVVTTGIQDINHFEISSGLQEGEKVVTGPYSAVSKTLRSGQKVRVVSKEQIFQND
jgi:HlyD family secretion protein